MATSITLNGVSYSIPAVGEYSWGTNVSNYLIALSTGTLSKAGGSFTLTADADFGANYGLKSIYFKSRGTTSTSGVIRLANAESVAWRNAANSADLSLKVNSSNVLEYNNNPILTLALGSADTVLRMNSAGSAYEFAKVALTSNVSGVLPVANGGTNSSTSLNNNRIIQSSGGAIVEASAITASRALASDSNGIPTHTSVTATELGYVSGVTSAIQTQIDAKQASDSDLTALAGLSSTGIIARTGSGTASVRAITGTSNKITVTNGDGVSGDPTLTVGSDIVQLTSTQALTNKDIDGGTASDTSRITIPKASTSTLTALTRKQGTVVYDTTVNALLVDDGSNLNSVGGGAGEKNYVSSGSNTAAGWAASGAGVTVATSTTAAELPRENTTRSGIKITGVSGSSAYAYYRFTLDDADLNRKLKIKFDQLAISGYTASDFKVDVYSNTASNYGGTSTRLVLSTDSSSITALANRTGQFQAAFDAPSSTAPYIEVRVGLNASATSSIVLSDVVVGPGIQPQGAVVGDWTSFTPTFTNLGTVTTDKAVYRRVGSTMEIFFRGTSGTASASTASMAIPASLTIDTSSISNTASKSTVLGQLSASGSSTNVIVAQPSSSTSVVYFAVYSTPDTLATGSGAIGSTTIFTFNARIPISEWAGSGTINVAQNDVEYASNSSSSDAADTSSFAYGPSGSTGIIGTTALTAQRAKRVRFQTPISAGDRVELEIYDPTSGSWMPSHTNRSGGFVWQQQNGVFYGFGLQGVNSTDIDVIFERYYGPTGATFGAAGGSWASLSSSYKWRLKKTSGAAAVGFGNVAQNSAGLVKSAGQLLGTNTNDSAATGYVGEILSSTQNSAQNAAATTTYLALTSVTLTAGDWDLSAMATLFQNAATMTSTNAQQMLIGTTSASSSGTTEATDVVYFNVGNGDAWTHSIPRKVISISSTTTYYLNVMCRFSAGTPQWKGMLVARRVR